MSLPYCLYAALIENDLGEVVRKRMTLSDATAEHNSRGRLSLSSKRCSARFTENTCAMLELRKDRTLTQAEHVPLVPAAHLCASTRGRRKFLAQMNVMRNDSVA